MSKNIAINTKKYESAFPYLLDAYETILGTFRSAIICFP